MAKVCFEQKQQDARVAPGRVMDMDPAPGVQECALYLNRSRSGWLRSKSQDEIAPFILALCRENGIPGPGLILSSAGGFDVKWPFTEPISSLARWEAVQKFLHEKFECLGSDPDPEDRQAPREVCVLHRDGVEGTFDDFARRLPLTKDAGRAYQAARIAERRKGQKRQPRLKENGEGPDWTFLLPFFHQPEPGGGWMCVRQMPPSEKGRRAHYDWFPAGRMRLEPKDGRGELCFSAAEFAIKKRSEKWVRSIRCNFLSLLWERSELDLDKNPTPEEAAGLIHARCDERRIPRPTLILSTEDGAFLVWTYEEAVPKLEPLGSFHFNEDWSDVERFLFSQFWDLGADPRQLHAAAMVRLPGSANTAGRGCVLEAAGGRYSFPEMLARARGETDKRDIRKIPHGWEHDLLAFHRGSRDLVCLGYFDAAAAEGAERAWRQRWVRADRLLDELSRFDLEQDLYISQLEFSARKRDVEHVASMRVNFLDIDWKRLEENDLTPEAWKDRILEHCRDHRIPEPNAVVFSGNGLHVKWIYTAPITREERGRWDLAQRLLLSQFKELGADAASIDAARVLRVPGSRNGKPGTADRRVRLLHHSAPGYSFDAFLDKVKASVPVDPVSFHACLAEFAAPLSRGRRAEGQSSGFSFNFVNITRCPEEVGFERRDLDPMKWIRLFRERCRQVCDVGIPEPNRFIDTGHGLLAMWEYDHPLPAVALSRWEAVQEFLTHHFQDWGAETGPASPGTESETVICHRPAEYSFDALATDILPWSQAEVRRYEDEKEENKANKARTVEPKRPGFTKRALARYKDIVHLLRMRRAASDGIPEGYRELCVFWAMNCGIQAGLINGENFDSHVQKLTALCGAGFDDCSPETLASLRGRLLNGQKTYAARTQTLIKELGITPEEQRQMKVITPLRRSRRYRIPRGQWLASHSQEAGKPWEKLHVSRSTYFARRKRQRDAIAQKRAAHELARTQLRTFLTPLGQVCPYIMRGMSEEGERRVSPRLSP